MLFCCIVFLLLFLSPIAPRLRPKTMHRIGSFIARQPELAGSTKLKPFTMYSFRLYLILISRWKTDPAASLIVRSSSVALESSSILGTSNGENLPSVNSFGLDKLLTDKIEGENQRKQALTSMKHELGDYKVKKRVSLLFLSFI